MIKEIAAISPKDAEAYPAWDRFWEKAAGLVQDYVLAPAPTLAQLFDRARATGDEDILETMLTVSMKDLVEEHFESEQVRGAFIGAAETGDPASVGSAFAIAYFHIDRFTDPRNMGLAKGSMGAITQAMARSATNFGAEVRTDSPVSQIIVRDGHAVGVALEDGAEFYAPTIVSNADPKRTFLDLLDPDDLDSDFRRRVKRLKTQFSSVKLHCTLTGLPDFSRHLGPGFDPKMLAMIKICPSVEYFEANLQDALAGRFTNSPQMYIQIPSVYDDSLAPPGHHVMSMWMQLQPVTLPTATGTTRTSRSSMFSWIPCPSTLPTSARWSTSGRCSPRWTSSVGSASPTATSANSTPFRASSSLDARCPGGRTTTLPSTGFIYAAVGLIPAERSQALQDTTQPTPSSATWTAVLAPKRRPQHRHAILPILSTYCLRRAHANCEMCHPHL